MLRQLTQCEWMALSLPEQLDLANNDKNAHYREQRRNRCHHQNNRVLESMTQERHAVHSTKHKSHPDYGHHGIECRVELFPNQSHFLSTASIRRMDVENRR